MKKNVIIVAWLIGLAAIAWACGGRAGTTHSGNLQVPDTAVFKTTQNEIDTSSAKEIV